MEKKFILTFHIAESELSTLAAFFYGKAQAYMLQSDTFNNLRCNTNLHLITSNMEAAQHEDFENLKDEIAIKVQNMLRGDEGK